MKIKSKLILIAGLILAFGCSENKTVELELTPVDGYGVFESSMRMLVFYQNNKNDIWSGTQLKTTGVPSHWSDVKYGDIETNARQTIYQNYLQGNVSEEHYATLQKKLNWNPDPSKLSKEAIKTRIAYASGIDENGELNLIFDSNNNLDFSDDLSFIPVQYSSSAVNTSDALKNAVTVSYERLVRNKKKTFEVPIYVSYSKAYNIFMYNFPQHFKTHFNDVAISVCSDEFTSLTYRDVVISKANTNKNDESESIQNEKVGKKEYINIAGSLYKNLGINSDNNTLKLEKTSLEKNELYSTQVGFKSPSFEGKNIYGDTVISSEQLLGKYVLLDFWESWCGPCIKEFANLKILYQNTDRNSVEIIGVFGDSSPDAIKKIIEKDSVEWFQLQSNDVYTIKENFDISSYPTTFLIDPSGIIIAKNLRGEKLIDKVMELSQK